MAKKRRRLAAPHMRVFGGTVSELASFLEWVNTIHPELVPLNFKVGKSVDYILKGGTLRYTLRPIRIGRNRPSNPPSAQLLQAERLVEEYKEWKCGIHKHRG